MVLLQYDVKCSASETTRTAGKGFIFINAGSTSRKLKAGGRGRGEGVIKIKLLSVRPPTTMLHGRCLIAFSTDK
jgi:hypothetical protein